MPCNCTAFNDHHDLYIGIAGFQQACEAAAGNDGALCFLNAYLEKSETVYMALDIVPLCLPTQCVNGADLAAQAKGMTQAYCADCTYHIECH